MNQLLQIPIEKVLFLDIETVPLLPSFEDLDVELQKHWQHKFQFLKHDENIDAAIGFSNQAGIYAEFGKIICISVGRIKFENDEKVLSLKSFYGDDEKELLTDFATMLRQHNSSFKFICGHNIKEFDIPFIARRMIINQIQLPAIIDLAGKKNYEVEHLIDTLNLWKFGDFKHYTSLALLTNIMGIPTSKSDMEGKDVARVYYQENNLKRIESYCKQDVVAVAQLFLKFRLEKIIEEQHIRYAY
jgi:hypothetical protein